MKEDRDVGLTLSGRASDFFREVAFHVGAYWLLRMEAFKLSLAIRLADVKQRARNKRYHVVLMEVGVQKNGSPLRRLRSIDESGFHYCRRKGWLPKRMSYLELEQKSFYSTPLSLNNSYSQSERKKAMAKYMRYQKVINHIRL